LRRFIQQFKLTDDTPTWLQSGKYVNSDDEHLGISSTVEIRNNALVIQGQTSDLDGGERPCVLPIGDDYDRLDLIYWFGYALEALRVAKQAKAEPGAIRFVACGDKERGTQRMIIGYLVDITNGAGWFLLFTLPDCEIRLNAGEICLILELLGVPGQDMSDDDYAKYDSYHGHEVYWREYYSEMMNTIGADDMLPVKYQNIEI
jgi:hypothetical protein